MTEIASVSSLPMSYQGLHPDTTDHQLMAFWLRGKSAKTIRMYRQDAEALLAFAECPLRTITLDIIYAFLDERQHLKPASRNRTLMAIKSLYTFASRLRYVPFNLTAVVTAEKIPDRLAQRILDEDDISAMIYQEPNLRNQTLLKLLYKSGMRADEIARLCWDWFTPRKNDKVQITVLGKGASTREILIPKKLFETLLVLKGDAQETDPVFCARNGGRPKKEVQLASDEQTRIARKQKRRAAPNQPSLRKPLSVRQIEVIVRKAAERVGIQKSVSPHWYRHAHASHAQDRGAPLALVRDTLGHKSIATTGRYSHARPESSSGDYLPM